MRNFQQSIELPVLHILKKRRKLLTVAVLGLGVGEGGVKGNGIIGTSHFLLDVFT